MHGPAQTTYSPLNRAALESLVKQRRSRLLHIKRPHKKCIATHRHENPTIQKHSRIFIYFDSGFKTSNMTLLNARDVWCF